MVQSITGELTAEPSQAIGCRHCGLSTPAGAEYCCFGCELAAKIREEGDRDHARLLGTFNLSLVLSMVIMMLSLFLYAEDVFDAHGDTELAWMRSAYRVASAVLATPVMVLAGFPLLKHAFQRLRRGHLSMEALIAAGAFSAFAISLVAVFNGSSAIYFESATAAIVLTTLGRYLEATARSRASKLLGPMLNLSRSPVLVATPGGNFEERPASAIAPGDTVRVALEETVPVDLVLISETAEIDLGVITGEPRPQLVSRGAVVPAGAVVLCGALEGSARSSARESTAEKLALLARSLREHPSASMRWADRLAGLLTPLVLVVAVSTAIYWAEAAGAGVAVVNALAVVLVACPCTYGVAAPLVHWLVLKRALAIGALVRSPEAIEKLDRVRIVAFDKTGTLTSALEVKHVELHRDVDRAHVLGLVRALEDGSRHPVARALFAHAAGTEPEEIFERRFIPGAGVVAKDPGGASVLLRATGGVEGDVELVLGEEVIARFSIDEQLKPEASAVARALSEDGRRVLILSGDKNERTQRVAAELGLEAHGGLSPAQKAEHLRALGPHVAMIGDGLNDAPAIAGVSVSVAIGGATDLLRGLADVALEEGDLRRVPELFALARQAMSTVRRMIVFSTLYNAVFIALAAAGALRPVFAGLSMLIASLLALAFASRLEVEVEDAPC